MDNGYTDYPKEWMLLFGVTYYNNVLLKSSIFIDKNSIGYLDIVECKWLYILKKWSVVALYNSEL